LEIKSYIAVRKTNPYMGKTITLSRIVLFFFSLSLMAVSYRALTNAAGPPAGYTGAPINSNCTSCHTGSVITSGTGWNAITLTSTIPAGGYCAGTTYTITLSYTQTGITKYGFQATALNSSNTMAGSFIAGFGTSTQSSGGISYINQNSSGNTFASGTASWTFSWTAPSSTSTGTVTFYVALNAANNNGNELGDQIYTKSFSFTQGAAPTAVITADKTTICLGDTIHFHASGNNSPTSYAWTFGSVAAPTSSTNVNPVVVYNTTGTYNAVLNNSNGCGSSGFVTQPITILAKPSSTVTPSGNLSLCGPNDSIVLSAPAQPGTTCLWYPTGDTSHTITVKNPGTYRVTVTNTNNCSSTSANVVVTTHSIPVVTLTSSADSICSGDTVTFTGSGNFMTYAFSKNASVIQSSALHNYKTITLSSSDVFGVVVTDSFGCKSAPGNTLSVLVRTPAPAPVVSCDTSTSSSVKFTWNALSNVLGYEVSADTGKTWTAPSSGSTGLSHTISGLTGGRLVPVEVRAVTQGACARGLAASHTCQTLGCPYVSFTYTGQLYSCVQSDTIPRSELISIANVNAIKYAVNINNAGYAAALTVPVSIHTGANAIHIKILDSLNTGCPQTDSVITVTGINSPVAKPVLSFSSSAIDTARQFCLNDIQAIYSSKPAGAGRYMFTRNGTDTLQNGLTNSFLSGSNRFANNDLARVIAIDSNYGCFKISDPLTIKVNPLPKPGFSYTGTATAVQFTDSSTGKVKGWSWNFGDASIPSLVKNPAHTYATGGTYHVSLQVTDSNNCMDTVGKTIHVSNVGIAQLSVFDAVNIYPNPAHDAVTVSFSMKERSDLDIRVMDMKGAEVFSYNGSMEDTGQKEIAIPLYQCRQGIYILLIGCGEQQQVMKFIRD
jgi:PKD repeat protein